MGAQSSWLGGGTHAPLAEAANVITVVAGEGENATVDSAAGTVELTTPGTFTIYAEDTGTEADRDGYINSVTTTGSAPTGLQRYAVRIAYPDGGGLYSAGAKFVGYVDLTGTDANDYKGNLAIAKVRGYWGAAHRRWGSDARRPADARIRGLSAVGRFSVASGFQHRVDS